jgi:hypothetical protein
MAQIRISLDQSLIDDLQAQADAAGITLSALLAEKAQFAPAAAPASTQDVFTLDQAADAFLRVLAPGHADLIRQCANDTRQKPAAYLLSAITLAYENGQTSLLLPAYVGERLAATAPAQHGIGHCQWCGHDFQLTRPGQIYCPTPSVPGGQSCSRQAALAPIVNRRQAQSADLTYAPSPKHTLARA